MGFVFSFSVIVLCCVVVFFYLCVYWFVYVICFIITEISTNEFIVISYARLPVYSKTSMLIK